MASAAAPFSFATPSRVVVGPGSSADVPALAARWGSPVLVVLGRHVDAAATPGLAGLPDGTVLHRWSGEPTLDGVEAAVEVARRVRPQVVIGWGGGSVIDLAKCVGALTGATGPVLDHLEVVGAGAPLPAVGVPVIAVPTTAGTGAEATANAPVLVPQHRVKVSLRGPSVLPTLAVVDPELTLGCPPAVTAASGLDALTQCLEAYCTPAANALSDLLARDGLVRAARSLRRAYEHGDDLAARTDLSLAALLSGMALANSRLGAVHGLAAPLGGLLGAPHGELCAATLAATCEVNVRALTARAPGSPSIARYGEVAQILTGEAGAGVQDGVAAIRDLVDVLAVRPLGALGLDAVDHGAVADAAMRASSMRGNPVELTRDELLEILDRSA